MHCYDYTIYQPKLVNNVNVLLIIIPTSTKETTILQWHINNDTSTIIYNNLLSMNMNLHHFEYKWDASFIFNCK